MHWYKLTQDAVRCRSGTVSLTNRSCSCLFPGAGLQVGPVIAHFVPETRSIGCLVTAVAAAQSSVERKEGEAAASRLGHENGVHPSPPEGGGFCSLLEESLQWSFTAIRSRKTWSGGSPAVEQQMGLGEQTDQRTGALLCFQPPIGVQTGTATPAAASAVCQS